jgi:hypothetical protein
LSRSRAAPGPVALLSGLSQPCLSRRGAAARLHHAFARCRKPVEFGGRTTRSCDELTAAVGALPAQDDAGARFAERAFERADSRLLRIGWQIAVAAFTAGSQLEHGRRGSCGTGRAATRPTGRDVRHDGHVVPDGAPQCLQFRRVRGADQALEAVAASLLRDSVAPVRQRTVPALKNVLDVFSVRTDRGFARHAHSASV